MHVLGHRRQKMNASGDPGARAKADPQADHEPTLVEWAGGAPAAPPCQTDVRFRRRFIDSR